VAGAAVSVAVGAGVAGCEVGWVHPAVRSSNRSTEKNIPPNFVFIQTLHRVKYLRVMGLPPVSRSLSA